MNKSFYFQHDYNAANDHKILFLRQQLGIEGYGIYFYILEQLAQANGRLPLKILPVLAMQAQTTADKVAAVIKNYDLFILTENEFFSARLMQQIAWRLDAREYGREGGLKSGKNRKCALNEGGVQIPFEGLGSKGDKGDKGKEIKDTDIRRQVFYENLVPFITKYKKEILREFFEYWTEIGDGQKKMRFERERVFQLSKRLARWQKNEVEKNNRFLPESRKVDAVTVTSPFRNFDRDQQS